MPWRYWLIDVPAHLFDLLSLAWRYALVGFLIVANTTLWGMAVIVLTLWAFGIRWGW